MASSASSGEMMPELKQNFSNKIFEDGLMNIMSPMSAGVAGRGMGLMASQFKSEHGGVHLLPPAAFGYHPAHYDSSALASLHGHAPLYHSREQTAFSHA